MVRTFLTMTTLVAFAAPSAPIIIGHRGASGHRPEHTLAAYRLAAEMGADYIEPDLVVTKDGVLVARHENEIGGTTDAADRFPARRTTKRVDGRDISGWFAEDFTLTELRTLRAKERLPFRSKAFDGMFPVPTLDEVLDLAQQLSRELRRPIGVYPETKHPDYLRRIGLPLEEPLADTLESRNWNTREAPVFVQSFEAASLRILRGRMQTRLIQLIDERTTPISDGELAEIKGYADGVGLNRRLVVPADADGRLLPPTDVVRRAKAAGLLVHVWTLRNEGMFLSPSYDGDARAEYRQFRDLGVDGIFTDFPDVAVAALRGMSAK